MAAADDINRVFREFTRYTGDGLPNPPVNAPLPVGDPQSGVHHPKKADIRAALIKLLIEAGDSAEAAQEALAEFERKYLGAYATDPTSDNQGQPITEGALYFNTANGVFRVYHSGAWQNQSLTLNDGDVTPAKLSPSAKNYVAGSGVLDVRTVYRTDGQTRGRASISSGSDQLTFNQIDLKAGDYIWLSGAAGTIATHQVSFTVLGSPLQSRTLYIVCDGYIFNSNDPSGGIPVLATDTPAQVAGKIRAGSWPGWTVGGSGTTVTFTRNDPGATLGAHWSDIDFAIIPKNETVVTEGSGFLQARVLSVSGNVATLDTQATASVTDALIYRDVGMPIRKAMDADPSIKEVALPEGEFWLASGLWFKGSGSRLRGAGTDRTTLYALPMSSSVAEFRSATSGGALLGVNVEDFTLNMQNARRHGIFMCRLWDGSGGRRVLITGVHPSFIGMRIGRDPTAPGPVNGHDQTVVSQSVTLENFHVIRTNPSQNNDTPVFYQEYVQEGTYVNVKAIGGTDVNGHGVTVAMQLEGCRGMKFVGSSFAGANKGLRITSVSGETEGISLLTPTLETNAIAVSLDGGPELIEDVSVLVPRIIGGGNKFVINKCIRGYFDTQDRLVEIGGGSANDRNVIVCDRPAYVTDTDNKNVIICHKRDDNGFHYVRATGGHRFDVLNQVTAMIDIPTEEGWGAGTLLFLINGVLQQRRLLIGPADSGGSGFRAIRAFN